MRSSRTSVLEARGVSWASSKAQAQRRLGQLPGVLDVSVNPVAQTASITYDADVTNVRELTDRIRDCGLHCTGRSVPDHVCDPLADDDPHANRTAPAQTQMPERHDAHHGVLFATLLTGGPGLDQTLIEGRGVHRKAPGDLCHRKNSRFGGAGHSRASPRR